MSEWYRDGVWKPNGDNRLWTDLSRSTWIVDWGKVGEKDDGTHKLSRGSELVSKSNQTLKIRVKKTSFPLPLILTFFPLPFSG